MVLHFGKLLLTPKVTCINMYTQDRNSPLDYMFLAWQTDNLIHIHETVGNLELWFDTILPSDLIMSGPWVLNPNSDWSIRF